MAEVPIQARRKASDFPPYQYQPFPRVIYPPDWKPNGAGGQEVIVLNEDDESLLLDEGWKRSPADLGITTHPSVAQERIDRTGVDLVELRRKREERQKAALAAEEEETEEAPKKKKGNK